MAIRHTQSHSRAVTNRLLRRLRSREARVGVIGLGYVGLPLAVAFARAGLDTVGFDIGGRMPSGAASRTSSACPLKTSGRRWNPGALAATADFVGLARVDAAVICVPTPLDKAREPDLSHVAAAVAHR